MNGKLSIDIVIFELSSSNYFSTHNSKNKLHNFDITKLIPLIFNSLNRFPYLELNIEEKIDK